MTEIDYALTVNGAPLTVRALPDEPLLYVLRDRLGLTGTRLGDAASWIGKSMLVQSNVAVPDASG